MSVDKYKHEILTAICLIIFLNGCSLDDVRPDINVDGDVRLSVNNSSIPKEENGNNNIETNDGSDSSSNIDTNIKPNVSGSTAFVDGKEYNSYIKKQYDSIIKLISDNIINDENMSNIYFRVYYSGMTDAGGGRLEPASVINLIHKANTEFINSYSFSQIILNIANLNNNNINNLSALGKSMITTIDNLCVNNEITENVITLEDSYSTVKTKMKTGKYKGDKRLTNLLLAMSKNPSKTLKEYRNLYESVYNKSINDSSILMDLFPGLKVDIPTKKSQLQSFQVFEDGNVDGDDFIYKGYTSIDTINKFFNSSISPNIQYSSTARDENGIMKVSLDANYKLIVFLGCSGGVVLNDILNNHEMVISKIASVLLPNQVLGFNAAHIIVP